MNRFTLVVVIPAFALLTAAAVAPEKPAAATPGGAGKSAGTKLAQSSPPPAPATPATPDRASSGPATSSEAVSSAELLKQGAELFAQTCATCHMADGSGVPYLQPSIKGSAWLSAADPQPLLSLILRGSAILGEASNAYDNDMAPQDHLGDAEVAAVATYVRQRFAAAPIAEPVTPAQVATARCRPGLPQ